MRFEDQVTVLCARALAAKEEPDVRTILSELRNILHQHIQSLRAGLLSAYAPAAFDSGVQIIDKNANETGKTTEPVRTWRQVVQEIANEQDHDKALRLSDELNRLLKRHDASQEVTKRSA